MIEAAAPSSPSQPASSGPRPGQDVKGRFQPGNKIGRGNILARRVVRLRAAILRAEKPEDVEKVIAAMRTKALTGDAVAAKVYLDRVMGPVTPMEIDARIEGLESQIEALTSLLRAAQSAPQVELRQAG